MKVNKQKVIEAATNIKARIEKRRNDIRENMVDSWMDKRIWFIGKKMFSSRDEARKCLQECDCWWYVDFEHGYQYSTALEVLEMCKLCDDDVIDLPYNVITMIVV